MRVKLMFILPSMAGGGAEKVALLLMRYFAHSQFNIFLVLFKQEGEYLSQLPENIHLVDLKKRSKFDFLSLIGRLKDTLEKIKPDVILSFITYANIISLISSGLTGNLPKLIISHRNYHELQRRFAFKQIIYPFCYRRARKIIAISEGIKNTLIKDWKIQEDKICVIYNPIDINAVNALKKVNVEHPFLVSNRDYKVVINIGRLEKPKNQELLLSAFQKLLGDIDARLIILGQGRLEQALKRKAQVLGIQNKVSFVGFQNNPYAWLSRSDVFVLSSNYEGFGNVIIEAMACGVPVISTDCPYGPGEIIANSINGVLVKREDSEELVQAMTHVLLNPETSKKLAQNALESVANYDIHIIGKRYEEALSVVIDNEDPLSP